MRAIRPNTRRRPLWHTVLLAIVAIAIGGAGTVAALAYLKVIDPAKLAFWRRQEAIPAGCIPVPIAARPIPAFTEVTGDYLTDPKTLGLARVYMPPRAIPKGTILNVSKIRGRVTARAVGALYNFTEDDFLPVGTHPGVAGGTPEGKLAITLNAGKLKGVVWDLKVGDHVVLQASTAVDMPGAGHSNGGRFGTNVVVTPDKLLLPKGSFVRTLVQDGVVVTAAHTRYEPISASSLTQGSTTRTVPVQEIVIAVDLQEAGELNAAMKLNDEITCMARSGRPAPAARIDGQAYEERNARQGSGGNGHHTRLRPDGSDSFCGGDDRKSTAVHTLQRTG